MNSVQLGFPTRETLKKRCNQKKKKSKEKGIAEKQVRFFLVSLLNMYFLVIQTAILSILFIFIVHNIIYFFQDNLTIPKTKDLVSLTEKKYDEIYNVMKKDKTKVSSRYAAEEEEDDEEMDNKSVDSSTTFIENLPTALDMKEELKNFLKLHQ